MSTSTSPVETGREGTAARAKKRWPWWVVVLAAIAATLLLLIAAAGVVLWRAENRYEQNLESLGNPFSGIPEAERPAASTGAMNILLLGSDSRISAGDPSQWQAGAQRTDTIMVAHIPRDRDAAYVISIPRDAWVEIPGRGMHKVNAAFALGGPSLLVRTIEKLTGIRIDHVATVDFEGFASMTDALGGVTVPTPEGPQHLDGPAALAYVRERQSLPGGDLDRIDRQQIFIRAVAQKVLSGDTLTNPLQLDRFLDALTKSMAVDDAFEVSDMRSLAISMRGVRADDVAFMTVPLAGVGRSPDGQSIVRLDEEAGAKLWKAIQNRNMAEYVANNEKALLPDSAR